MNDKIKVAREDGLDHIIPFISVFDSCPKELKKVFGRGAWKYIANNSRYRNKRLAPYLANKIGVQANITSKGFEYIRKMSAVDIYNMIDSSNEIVYDYISSRILKVTGSGLGTMYSTLARDTHKFCKELELPFSPEWSVEKILEKHRELPKLIAIKNMGDEVFPISKRLEDSIMPFIQYFKNKEFYYQHNLDNGIFTLFHRYSFDIKVLLNAMDYVNEAREMNHCIDGYITRAKEGGYAALHIDMYDRVSGRKLEQVTIGLMNRSNVKSYLSSSGEMAYDSPNFILDQIYGPGNAEPSKAIIKFFEYLSQYVGIDFDIPQFSRIYDRHNGRVGWVEYF